MTDDTGLLLAHLADRYDIERELGGGGMSRVFLATERALARRVVIKVLAPELSQRVNLERFQQEIATSATLQHPQIVPVYHAGGEGALRYYVMPYISGESLRARLQRDGRLPARDVRRLIVPLARALAYAHRQGVVHRDVKPENILLSEGEPMLADFGIAKVVRDGSGSGLTSAGMSIGTVTYMPPEQVAADPNIDGRADVYSLAAVAYELLAGRPPFTGTPAQVMSAHMVRQPDDLAALLPPSERPLAAAVMSGLEKDVTRRPDAEAFAESLDLARDEHGSGGSAGNAGATGAARGTRRWLVGGGIAAALAITALLLRPGSDEGSTAHAAPPAIAVLSFEMIGPTDDAYLSAGVTEEITTGLAQLPGVRVLSRATVRAYADSQFTPTDYGSRVGVRALVEGSVQRAGEQLRVTARLVDTRDGSAIWSNRYERSLEDVFRTQQEISGAVAAALSRHLGLRGSAPRVEYAADAAAYDLYLRGRFALRERGEQGLRSAIALFSEAATRDPKFARAHAGIAEASALLPIYSSVARPTVADTIRASAARAIALDSLLATPHVALGLLDKGLGNWEPGERALLSALRLDANDASAHQNLGELYFMLGRFEDATAALARAAALEPTDVPINAEYAYALRLTGRADSAARYMARATASAPRNPFVAYTRGIIAELDGDLAEAARYMGEAAELAPIPFFRAAHARALVVIGDTAGGARIRRELVALGDAPGAAYARVVAGLVSDPLDSLFAGLARAAEERDAFVMLVSPRVDWYDRLRDDPRFAAFARSLGLPPSSIERLRSASDRPGG